MLYMRADPPEVAGFTSTMGSGREINIKNSGSNIPVRITDTLGVLARKEYTSRGTLCEVVIYNSLLRFADLSHGLEKGVSIEKVWHTSFWR